MFDPYVRGDSGLRDSRGSGLGLSISARIVEAMGGRMRAENRDNGGARFEIEAVDWPSMQAVIERHDPSLILLDRHLCSDDGLELARRLRDQDRRQQ